MTLFARLATLIVAFLHIGFLILEMVLWTTPTGREIFGTTEAFAAESASLALNQGLYNGFLAAGLLWAVSNGRRDLASFFLGCVIIAGIVGALTVSSSIMIIQGLPAIIALLLVWLGKKRSA